MTDLMTKLEDWNNGHKARACSVHHENGYGSTSWVVKLHGNGPSITVVESVECGDAVDADGHCAGYPYTKDDEGWWFEIVTPKRGEWAGLKRTLTAALEIAEELKL